MDKKRLWILVGLLNLLVACQQEVDNVLLSDEELHAAKVHELEQLFGVELHELDSVPENALFLGTYDDIMEYYTPGTRADLFINDGLLEYKYSDYIWAKEFVSCWVLANFAWHKDPSLSFSLNFDFTNPYNSIYVSAECELELEDYTLMLGNKFAEILYPSALDFYSGGSKDEPTLNFDLKFHVGSFLEVDGRRYDISFDLLINFSTRAEVFADDYDLHNLPHEVKLEIIF